MVSVNKINNVSFGRLPKGRAYQQNEPATVKVGKNSERYITPQEEYIDSRIKEQDTNFKKALEKQNALIGSSLIAMVNYLNGNSDADSTKELIQNKLIKKAEQKRIEI